MLPFLIGALIGGAAALWLAKPEIQVNTDNGSSIAYALLGIGGIALVLLFLKVRRK